MASDLSTLIATKIDITFIVGEVVKDFTEGAGLYVCIAGFLIILTLVRRPGVKEVRR